MRALFSTILERGGQPYLLLELPDQDEILFNVANNEQLDITPAFRKLAYEQFESRMRIHSATNPRALTHVDPARQKRRQKALCVPTDIAKREDCERLERLMRDLLDLSKIESGESAPNCVPARVGDLIGAATSALANASSR